MAQTLVSLVSEKTIPNVELIKEFKDVIQRLIFVTTPAMEKNGQTEWIIDAAGVREVPSDRIIVNPFDPKDIENKLRSHSFGETDEFIVNITGGTKLMSLIVHSVFRDLGARIYYVTGQGKSYLKIFPLIGKDHFVMEQNITLDEYLTAYGFKIEKRDQECAYSRDYLESFLKKYLDAKAEHFDALNGLRTLRSKKGKKPIKIKDQGIVELIDYFNFHTEGDGELTKQEINFLTGEWFEWLTYIRVKNDLSLDMSEIGLGYKLYKGGVLNEMDVMFVKDNKLYTIECKTGITVTEITEDGKTKKRNLLGEIIYKSDSLQNKLGLFVNTSVFTLSKIYEVDGATPFENMKNHLDRATQSHINVFGRKDLTSGNSIKSLLGIS